VVDKILDIASEAEALRQANAAAKRPMESAVALNFSLPPVLEAMGGAPVQGGEGEVRIRLKLRTLADAPVTTLQAKADGRPAQAEFADAASGEEREIRVRFEGQPQSITLMAENKHGRSPPAVLAVAWPEMPSKASSAQPVVSAAPAAAVPLIPAPGSNDRKPRLYVLAIGVGRFMDPSIPQLDMTSKDVRDFAAEMKRQKGKLYREVDVRLLVDQTATRDAIMDGLDWLQKQVTQHDVGMLFVSGHGDNNADMGYVYITHNYSLDSPRKAAVSFKDFNNTLNALAGKAIFFIDTCHSGNVLGEKKRALTKSADPTGAINELLSSESGVVVFSASTGRQYALENSAWGNGAFTKALVEGLSGKADFRKKGYVTHKMLDYYISDRVKELTDGKQTPVTQAPGGVPDFPLSMAK
jgi:hypothetical protein